MSDISSHLRDVQEVRRGLFRVRWDIDDVRGGPMKETFQLCGLQSGQSYVISCYPRQHSRERRDRLPYTVRLSVKKVSYDDDEDDDRADISAVHAGLNSAAIQHQQPLVKPEVPQQQLGESAAAAAAALEARSKVLESLRPAFVWVSRDVGNEVQLTESNSGTWRLSTYNVWKQRPVTITIWMDFGTKTPGERTIANGLCQLFDKQIQCDVEFELKDGTTGAHVAILSAGSPVFSAMFQSGMEEAQKRKVTIPDIEMKVFSQLLTYLYTGSSPKLEDENITQLLFEAADKYDVETLKHECVDVLLTRLTVDNAVDSLIWSHLHSIPELFEATMKFVASHGHQLCFRPEWTDLMKSYPDLCLAATQRIVGRFSSMESDESEIMNLD